MNTLKTANIMVLELFLIRIQYSIKKMKFILYILETNLIKIYT
jgi:hypothetical protein